MVQGRPPAEARPIEQRVAADVTKVQEIGGLLGRRTLAALVAVVVSRRTLIRLFQVPGLIIMPLSSGGRRPRACRYLYVGMFLAGFVTVAQFSFWGNYLPRVYPVHLRGTGESFAANIGGRLIGTSFAWVTATLAVTPDRAYAPTKVAIVAGAVGLLRLPRRVHRQLLAAGTEAGGFERVENAPLNPGRTACRPASR